jgi:hypothetical protein
MERWGAREFIKIDEANPPVNCGVTLYRGHPELGENGRLILNYYNKKLYG